jgi:hypothetical protein
VTGVLHLDPERLTPRARAYLLGLVVQHAGIATFIFCTPALFMAPSFDGIKKALAVLPAGDEMRGWGVVLAVAAVLAATAAVRGSEALARAALLMCVVTEGAWLGGYLASWAAGSLISPVGVIVWGSMVYRDITMLRQPLRNPFEPILRRWTSEADIPAPGPA